MCFLCRNYGRLRSLQVSLRCRRSIRSICQRVFSIRHVVLRNHKIGVCRIQRVLSVISGGGGRSLCGLSFLKCGVGSSDSIRVVTVYRCLLSLTLGNQVLSSLKLGVRIGKRALSGCYVCLLGSHNSLSIRHVLSSSSFRRLSTTEIVLFGIHIVFRISDRLCITVSKRLTNSIKCSCRGCLLRSSRIQSSLRLRGCSFRRRNSVVKRCSRRLVSF